MKMKNMRRKNFLPLKIEIAQKVMRKFRGDLNECKALKLLNFLKLKIFNKNLTV
jgi:hypothetical protein